jgi:hypothetical protein
MTRRLMTGLTEIASLGVFVMMILTWAALLAGPGV